MFRSLTRALPGALMGAWLLLAAASAMAAELPAAEPFVVSPYFAARGPAAAHGAVVWLHGSYDSDADPAPSEPDWVRHLAGRGFDMWQFNRQRGQDALLSGGERLIEGLTALRRAGYRRVVVAGFSRGGFIGLAALARPDLVDAVAAISPAAHGTRPERRAQALADFEARLRMAGLVRLALVLLHDDPYDPDPDRRAAAAQASAPGRAGSLLLVDRTVQPRGHMGSFDPRFAPRYGACLAAFLDEAAGPAACAMP